MNKSTVRHLTRKKRQALSVQQQRLASQRLLLKLAQHPLFRNAKNIGFYIASDGEISPDQLLSLALKLGKHCYLPSVKEKGNMTFRLYQGKSKLVTNRYGISQPDITCQIIAAHQLDLVFVPLVAFDQRGNRLGMGGGYYDRYFAFKKRYSRLGPDLVGLAHRCQQVDGLVSDIWDIPMRCIATDERIQRVFKG
ncbi:5-formyltetrahydrofolate cyclo-ligase [Agarilytica rhodophyticola]|uniref:5-formyltetrahydrofolate cyclo-ligase n=1 Tax=Agarilytica rhodophyticola TaxID=1737490 RepID=UPI000B348CF5|nr:5-formyltetrahydrofolate cyclo-ligase [Agarilytica rhodophyticola]